MTKLTMKEMLAKAKEEKLKAQAKTRSNDKDGQKIVFERDPVLPAWRAVKKSEVELREAVALERKLAEQVEKAEMDQNREEEAEREFERAELRVAEEKKLEARLLALEKMMNGPRGVEPTEVLKLDGIYEEMNEKGESILVQIIEETEPWEPRQDPEPEITDVTEEEAKQEEDVADLPPPLEPIPETTAAGADEEKPTAPLLNRRE